MNMDRSLQEVMQDLLDQLQALAEVLQKNPDLAQESSFQTALKHKAEYYEEVQVFLNQQTG